MQDISIRLTPRDDGTLHPTKGQHGNERRIGVHGDILPPDENYNGRPVGLGHEEGGCCLEDGFVFLHGGGQGFAPLLVEAVDVYLLLECGRSRLDGLDCVLGDGAFGRQWRCNDVNAGEGVAAFGFGGGVQDSLDV